MDTLLQLAAAQILVPLAVASTLALVASKQEAPYLWK
jgi:hypothetical protein